MTAVPLRFQPAELYPGATAPRLRPRWLRVVGWTLAADATFVASVLATLTVRGLLSF